MAPPARSGVRDQVNSNSFDYRQWSRAEQSKDRAIDFSSDAGCAAYPD